MIARFDAERQALALMDHPNIEARQSRGVEENARGIRRGRHRRLLRRRVDDVCRKLSRAASPLNRTIRPHPRRITKYCATTQDRSGRQFGGGPASQRRLLEQFLFERR